MSDGGPPPLPPKQQGGVTWGFSSSSNNNGTAPRYSAEEAARALQEESQAYELIKQQKKGQQHGTANLRLDVTRSSSAGPSDWNKPRSNSLVSSSSANNISLPRTSHLLSSSSSVHTSGATTPVNSTPMSSSPVTPGMTQDQDLMSFRSPEKTNNDQILNMLQDLNASSQRGNVVAVVSSAATPLGGMISTPSMMGPSYPQHQIFVASSALRSTSFNIPGRPTTVNHLTPSMTPGFMNTSLNLNSNMMSVPAPPLPHRNAVFDPKRVSILANQWYPNQTLTSPLPYSANGPNSNVRSLNSVPPNAFNILSLNNSFCQPSFPYTPNIPLNIPNFENMSGTTNLPRLPLSSTPSCSPSISSISPQPPSVLARYASVKQKRTSIKNSDDLIDFGSSPTRDSRASQRGDVNSVLFEFDPIVYQVKQGPGKAQEERKHSPQKSISNDRSVNEGAVALSREASEMLRYKGHGTSSSIADDQGSSYYEQVDPFEYMRPDGSCRSDPVYDAYDGLRSPTGVTGDTFDVPPPLPPRASTPGDGSWEGVAHLQQPVVELRKNVNRARTDGTKRHQTIVDGEWSQGAITLHKTKALRADDEAVHFWQTIKQLRASYSHTDALGNPGLLHSACLDRLLHPTLSVKLQIFYAQHDPIVFTSNLSASVEHVVMQALVSLELDSNLSSDYLLKVRGVEEYLCGATALGESVYVHGCVKFDNDVLFTLVRAQDVHRPYLRTADDDDRVDKLLVETLLSSGNSDVLHYDRLHIATDQFERELRNLQRSGFLLVDGAPLQDLPSPMRSSCLTQVVKQICAIAGDVVTLDITEAVTFLVETCRAIQKSQGILDGEESFSSTALSPSGGSLVTGGGEAGPEQLKARLLDAISRLSAALAAFLRMYSNAFRVDFTVPAAVDNTFEVREASEVRDKVSVKVRGLHRLSSSWRFDEYFLEAQLYHGSRCVGSAEPSPKAKPNISLRTYSLVPFNVSLDIGARVNILPLESRIVLTVFGLRQLPNSDGDNARYIREEVGWTAIQCYSFDRKLCQGPQLLTLWPIESDRRLGPAPHSSDHPHAHTCPLLCVELPEYTGEVVFPEVTPSPPKLQPFADLDGNTQQQLKDIVERDIFTFNMGSAEDREVLWEKRHYLHHEPHALAKVLLAANSWDLSCLPDLHSMLANWAAPSPPDALHLLLPCFADSMVRTRAVDWLRGRGSDEVRGGLGSDELLAFLPQLVQAVKHETWDTSPVVKLLLERAITSPRLAHHLYWLLNQCLPQQTSMSGEREVVLDARYRRRLQLVTRALMVICGSNLENRLLQQEALLRSLYETAVRIKDTKDSMRMSVLSRELEIINDMLTSGSTSLPLSPALSVSGVEVRACAYYNSFTTPLRLAFRSVEPHTSHIHAIFKVGDDLRQDMLVIQMIRLMDRLWLQAGLDLKMVTFNVVPTGDRIGIIELVKDAETLRKIQTEYGVTGVFKDRPIAEWLAKQNPSALEYQRAVENFTYSCAGYCVATYMLGICDRHNDNIMLKTTGHLFHIDFGKFLGDAQKFGNIKRDRTPFVLTADMAYVINGGDKPSDKFHNFIDLCCLAFNVIRTNGHLLLYLFALMASSGVSGVSYDAVKFVQRALLLDLSTQEAGAFFARLIKDALKSWFTQVNFFIHNLAQLRFTNDPASAAESAEAGGGQLLSFIPRTYTMAEEGRVARVTVHNFQKRYNPNKFYVYILRVDRETQKEPSYLFRSYKEFSEFHQKLCVMFPLEIFHSLPRGVQIGRSEVSAVASVRKMDIELFLNTLFALRDDVAHADIVYTFLHPLYRDQEDTDIHNTKLKAAPEARLAPLDHPNSIGRGQIKMSMQYERGQLLIMVQHARNLPMVGNTPPSPYAKLYLLPDPNKRTKRKTKVCKKTPLPSFMEQISYRMSLEVVQQRTLEISLWSEDKFSENSYLGSCYLPLDGVRQGPEICEWLSLEHNIRTARDHILYNDC